MVHRLWSMPCYDMPYSVATTRKVPRLPPLQHGESGPLRFHVTTPLVPAQETFSFPSANSRLRVSLCRFRASGVLIRPLFAADIFALVSAVCGCAIQFPLCLYLTPTKGFSKGERLLP